MKMRDHVNIITHEEEQTTMKWCPTYGSKVCICQNRLSRLKLLIVLVEQRGSEVLTPAFLFFY